MKKNLLIVVLALLVCISSSFITVSPAVKANCAALPQSKVQPFCKVTYVDHRGHSIKLTTNILHASSRSLTFIFDGGEKLIISFTMIRPGHFIAESARSRDPQIIFYPSHSSMPIPMVGAVMITAAKPVSGNFSHLISDDDDEHLTLVAGTFSF
ncbi:hypothetical protein [Mucilaginibacter sp. UR6-11]|uniref:hypothetical protein n=1 Tax=Mucilaginibacter sp. UR6-11 TaxID=1435644 RepID=UPI001E5C681F|nr:hypothetical protein [Mucilaginibacter sp. UR6-11]MCC8424500.1 hypothetical protein [Mucilaginibacter sp. UR6-11]